MNQGQGFGQKSEPIDQCMVDVDHPGELFQRGSL